LTGLPVRIDGTRPFAPDQSPEPLVRGGGGGSVDDGPRGTIQLQRPSIGGKVAPPGLSLRIRGEKHGAGC